MSTFSWHILTAATLIRNYSYFREDMISLFGRKGFKDIYFYEGSSSRYHFCMFRIMRYTKRYLFGDLTTVTLYQPPLVVDSSTDPCKI